MGAKFEFAHYAAGAGVEKFEVQTGDDPNGDEKAWTSVSAEPFTADVQSKNWQTFAFAEARTSRFWRWKILSTDNGNSAVIWNVNFVYSLRSIATWSRFGGVVVELQLHDRPSFRSEASRWAIKIIRRRAFWW